MTEKAAVKTISSLQAIKGILTVRNERGLHTRPSTELVRCTTLFDADMRLCYQNLEVNAKSLLGILMLAAPKGSRIRVEARGHDAAEAVEALLSLAEDNFNIIY